jgi:hypothetical protein
MMMMIGIVFTTKISMVARNGLAAHEESGLARHVLREASALKGRIRADIGVERSVELKTSIVIFRKSLILSI